MGFSPAVAANAAKFNNPVHLNDSPTIAVVTSDAKNVWQNSTESNVKNPLRTTLHMDHPSFLWIQKKTAVPSDVQIG